MRIFEPFQLKSKKAPNRLAALPMEASDAAPDGSPSARTLERYRTLARGGWGIIFIEAVAPSRAAAARQRQLILTDKNAPEFSRLIDTIKKERDDTIVIMQLNHAGRYALEPRLCYRHSALDNFHGISPETPILTEGELTAAAEEMSRLVALASRTGADGADIKCCHGYLGVELLRPANNRPDSFGGSFENRSRLLRTVLEAAASFINQKDFIIGSRISLYEGIEGGLGDDAGETAPFREDVSSLLSLLAGSGASFVCETAGNPYASPEIVRPMDKDERRYETAALHHRLAARVKFSHPDLAVIGAGYTIFREEFVERAEAALAAGRADFIGLGRQNFADPETPNKLLNGDIAAVDWCKACSGKSCAWLLRSGAAEAGCVIYNDYYRRQLKALNSSERAGTLRRKANNGV